jgi:hypothetical protein
MRWTVEPSVLVRRGEHGPEQMLSLSVESETNFSGVFQVGEREVPVVAPQGASRHWIPVPAPRIRSRVTVVFDREERAVELVPARPWTVYLVHHSHLDVGYTDLQPRVMQLHQRVIDDVVRYARLTAGWPEGERFVWNCEATYPLAQYLEDRPPRDREALLEIIRSGQLEVTALLANMHSEACSAEELARTLYLGAELRRRYGITIDSAMQTDVPGHTWQLPQLLAGAGVKYLAVAPNNYRAPFLKLADGRVPRPFYWEGPDGSRVLTWFTDDGLHSYQEGNELGFIEGTDRVLERLPDKLLALEKGGYPYEGVHFRIQGYYTDNGPANLRIAETVRAWNREWLWPRVRLATNRKFFREMEARHGSTIPTFRADWPDWWVDGVGAAPRELALGRKTQALLPAAETFQALLAARGQAEYPDRRIRQAWTNLMLFDEHTWGAMASEKDALQGAAAGRAQWERKASFAHAAEEDAVRLMDSALAAWRPDAPAAPAPDRAYAVVTNGLPWERSGPVSLDLSRLVQEGWREFSLCDGEIPIPLQVAWDKWGRVTSAVFVAHQVPAMGRKTYELRRQTPPGFPALAAAENDCLRITTTEAGVASVYDKRLGQELAAGPLGRFERRRLTQDPNRWDLGHWRLEQQVTGVDTAGACDWQTAETGPVFIRLEASPEAPGLTKLTQSMMLYRELPFVTLSQKLDRTPPEGFEALYFAFPLAVPDAEAHLHIPAAVMRPDQDQLPGSCINYYAVQDYADVSGPGWGVTWASPDAPLVAVGEVRDEAPSDGDRGNRAHLFSRVWNNYWQTNFPVTTAQGGEALFRYAFQAHAGGFDPEAASRFGQEQRLPLLVEVLEAPAPAESLLRLEGAGLLAFKSAEDGDGYIARIAERSGRPATARLSFPGLRLAAARSAALTEEPGASLSLDQPDGLTVPLDPWQIKTLRLYFY